MSDLKNPVTNLESTGSVQSNETKQLVNAAKSISEKTHHRPARLWTVTYVCTVALQCFFVLGFAAGFTSPVLSELSDRQGYSSLRKKSDQDLFSVSTSSRDCRVGVFTFCGHACMRTQN